MPYCRKPTGADQPFPMGLLLSHWLRLPIRRGDRAGGGPHKFDKLGDLAAKDFDIRPGDGLLLGADLADAVDKL